MRLVKMWIFKKSRNQSVNNTRLSISNNIEAKNPKPTNFTITQNFGTIYDTVTRTKSDLTKLAQHQHKI